MRLSIANGIGIMCARFNCNALMTVYRHIVDHLYVRGSNSVASRCGKRYADWSVVHSI